MVTVDEVKTLKDGGNRLRIDTQELPPTEMATLFALKGGQFWACFSETVVKKEDIKIPEITTEGKYKSPSQEQRAILFRIWEKSGSEKVFEEYYIIKMSEINNKLREHLN